MDNAQIYALFTEYMTTLKESSYDDDKKEYMTNCEVEAVNFDAVKSHYAETHQLIQNNTPRSCDALFWASDNSLNFIEFKNTTSKRHFKEHKVREKVYCSLLIFSDICGKTIKDIVKNMNLIVVYNKEMLNRSEKNERVPTSPAMNTFRNILDKNIEDISIRFGFESFKSFCFKEVYTLNQDEFETHIAHISRRAENQ